MCSLEIAALELPALGIPHLRHYDGPDEGRHMSIGYQSDQGVVTLTIDRPAKKNAITGEMYETFVAHLKQAAADKSVRAVLITGAGNAFTAGNDLKDFGDPRFIQPDSLPAGEGTAHLFRCAEKRTVPKRLRCVARAAAAKRRNPARNRRRGRAAPRRSRHSRPTRRWSSCQSGGRSR